MVGETIGQYRILARLGEGGMGEVYLAEDLKLRRKAAVKVIATALTRDEARRQRFVQEALLAASVDHPHIAAIYDVDQAGDRTYIAMEYVQGDTLRQKLQGGALKPRHALDLSIQIADALARVHERGVVHRDLKPENVIVSSDGYAKVIDFGLAKLAEPLPRADVSQSVTTADAQIRTGDGLVLGTVAYMSPEQARGEPVDARSDIFSFGMLLHELLTGAAPFRRRSAADTLSAILSDPAPPLQIDDVAATDLQRVLRKCLIKDPAARYQTMRDVVVDLREARELVGTGERSVQFANARPDRRRRVLVAALVGVGVTAAALAGAAWWTTHRRASTEPPAAAAALSGRPVLAVMAFENLAGASDVAWLSKGLPSMLVTGLAQTPDLEVVGAQRLNDAARALGKDSVDAVDRSRLADVAQRAGARILVSGSIVAAGADYRIDARVEDVAAGRVVLAASVRGTDVLALADDLAARIRLGLDVRPTAPVHRVADVSSSSVEAYRLYSEGSEMLSNARFAEARALFERAVAIDPAFSLAYLQLSIMADLEGDADARRRHLDRAANRLDRLPERDAMLVQAARAALDGRADEAVRSYEAVIERYPDAEVAYIRLSLLYEPTIGAVPNAGKSAALLARGIHALPSSPGMLNQYGYAQMQNGDFDGAIATFLKYGRLRPDEPNAVDSLADAYLMAGEPERAAESFARAVAGGRLASRSGRALANAVRGRFDEALQDLPAESVEKAFILSRAGRMKDAVAMAGRGRRTTPANTPERAASFALLEAELETELGRCAPARQQTDAVPSLVASQLALVRRRWVVLADAIAGLCEARTSRLDQARVRLDRIKSAYLDASASERWWMYALEGEIALGVGKPAEAIAAFASGEPRQKMPFSHASLGAATALSLFANNLPSRDGRARGLAAQGRDAEAIAAYRDLLTPGRATKWTAMLEPRYVLALARLLDRSGQRDAARAEYRRFLDLWKHADADLPELADARRALSRGRESSESRSYLSARIGSSLLARHAGK